jgi:hypothetical protein
VVVAPNRRRDCGEHPPGTEIPASTQGWWCADDKEWVENSLRAALRALGALKDKAATPDMERIVKSWDWQGLSQGQKVAALGLRKPEVKTLIAGPDEDDWEPCFTDEDVQKILAAIDDAVKRAEAKASSPAGPSGQEASP